MTLADGTVFEARALILAGGAEHTKLGVPVKMRFEGRACPTAQPAMAPSLRSGMWR